MNNNRIIGIFDEEDVLLKGISKLKQKGIKIKDVISPYPIHGLDKALDIPSSRLAICSFLYGLTGATLALLMMWYMIIHDWPMDIGGKPNAALYKNLPAFIPITFECTILCAAHGMVLTFYLRSKILPGVQPYIPDYRVTDDKFVMLIEGNDANVSSIQEALKEAGATEIK